MIAPAPPDHVEYQIISISIGNISDHIAVCTLVFKSINNQCDGTGNSDPHGLIAIRPSFVRTKLT